MSQKNGHALESVTLTAMLRRWTSSLLLIAVAAAGALSAMILQNYPSGECFMQHD